MEEKGLPVIRFEVDISCKAEISFKELLKKQKAEKNKEKIRKDTSEDHNGEVLPNQVNEAAVAEKKTAKRRYNLIEELERKYMGGEFSPEDSSEDNDEQKGEGQSQTKTKPSKGNVQPDFYDSEDSFIDDTAIIKTSEAKHKSKLIKTQHGGFFANLGDISAEIQDQPLEEEVAQPQRKKTKPDWHPNERQQAALKAFNATYDEKKAAGEITKQMNCSIPICLDYDISKMDREIRESAEDPENLLHQKEGLSTSLWQHRGYLQELKKILPASEDRLKYALKRAELHWQSDQARSAKVHARQKFEMMVEETLAANKDKGITTWTFTPEIKKSLQEVFLCLQEFVDKTNTFREFQNSGLSKKKQESDKKSQNCLLKIRKHRQKTFSELLQLFPEGLVSIHQLRHFSVLPPTKKQNSGCQDQSSKAITTSDADDTERQNRARSNSNAQLRSPGETTEKEPNGAPLLANWNEEEAQLLLSGLKSFGRAPAKIAELIPNKTNAQVSRFIQKFEKWDINFTDQWNDEDDSKFLKGFEKYTNYVKNLNKKSKLKNDFAETAGLKDTNSGIICESDLNTTILATPLPKATMQLKTSGKLPNASQDTSTEEHTNPNTPVNQSQVRPDSTVQSNSILHPQKVPDVEDVQQSKSTVFQKSLMIPESSLPPKSFIFENPPVFSVQDFEPLDKKPLQSMTDH